VSAAIVLQARMGSRRLPGKTLASLAGQTVLAHCVERLRFASGLRVVVATTTRVEDDCVAREAEALGIATVRGPDEDVLARFVLAARQLSLTEIVRATADNPAVDLDAPRRVLDVLHATGADHVTEVGLPYGTAVEAVVVPALERAASLTAEPADREHVTAFLARDPRFVSLRAPAPAAVHRPGLRLTVDTAEDLEFVRRVFQRSGAPQPRPVPLAALIAAAATLSDIVPSGH
jgi:spore coat polysaccharide biosynthesis protein SpsF (cytidylyltransferase family)